MKNENGNFLTFRFSLNKTGVNIVAVFGNAGVVD
jgi:hypothetical protein